MNDIIFWWALGAIAASFGFGWFINSHLRKSAMEAMDPKLMVPRTECDLRHRSVGAEFNTLVTRIGRSEVDIEAEKEARHDLRDTLQPISIKVARLETSLDSLKDTVSEIRDSVKVLVERQG
jgi:hypothetical protein